MTPQFPDPNSTLKTGTVMRFGKRAWVLEDTASGRAWRQLSRRESRQYASQPERTPLVTVSAADYRITFPDGWGRRHEFPMREGRRDLVAHSGPDWVTMYCNGEKLEEINP